MIEIMENIIKKEKDLKNIKDKKKVSLLFKPRARKIIIPLEKEECMSKINGLIMKKLTKENLFAQHQLKKYIHYL
jgi:exonuclease I